LQLGRGSRRLFRLLERLSGERDGVRSLIFREVEDRDLILRARGGDVDAYNVLVTRWEKRVYSYLVKTSRNRDEAMDLCQETFLKAFQALRRLAEPDRFPSWLFRIAHNEAVSWMRRKRPETAEDMELERAAALGRRPGLTQGRADLALAVEQALAALSAEQREAVVLKVYEGFKFHEIAEILGCPVSTVKSRVYGGFEALKQALTPPGGALAQAGSAQEPRI
jgi:RNA polymerase sigma-70 factor, ECF subfamily